MRYKKLAQGRFLKRYQRFLVDLALPDGRTLTVHCPNTGAMTGCQEKGAKAYYTDSENPKRKYRHTLEWLELSNGSRASINTQRPNYLVKEAIEHDIIGELAGYRTLRMEQKYGRENSRIDILLSDHPTDQRDCYIEVKNVTLVEQGVGLFPDAVSLRGQKHLRELEAVAAQGQRAVLLFCINHTAIECLRPADKVDYDYGMLLRRAEAAGVELLAYQSVISEDEIRLLRAIPIDLDVAR